MTRTQQGSVADRATQRGPRCLLMPVSSTNHPCISPVADRAAVRGPRPPLHLLRKLLSSFHPEPSSTRGEEPNNTIREKLREMLKMNENARFIVTGDSLGGALAVLFPVVLAYHGENWMLDKCEGIYTYGQPRVGDEKLGEFMDNQLRVHSVQYVRCVYGNDLVPRLPYDDSTQLFKHFGTCLYYDSLYKGKIVEEEPNKNYFSIIMVIPKILNAVWELLRSFGIQYMKGPEYEEGLLMRIFRVIGLIVPGIPAHTPQDYVNCTRLRTPILSLQLQYQTDPTLKID